MAKSDWWGSTSSYTLEFNMQNRNSKNLEVDPKKEKDYQFTLHFLLSLLSYTAKNCISVGLDCPYCVGPFDTIKQENIPHSCLQAHLIEAMPQLRLPLFK